MFYIFSGVVVSGNNTKTFLSLGCSLKHSWCSTTPKISIVQLVLYSLMMSLAFPLMYLSQFVMLYEILSPKHQVNYHYFTSKSLIKWTMRVSIYVRMGSILVPSTIYSIQSYSNV